MDSETRQRLLELVYDLLPEGESAELRGRIQADAEMAAAYREAQETARLLAVLVARAGGGKLDGISRRRATRQASRLDSNRLKCSQSSSLLARNRCTAGDVPNSSNHIRVAAGSRPASSCTASASRQPNHDSASRKLTVSSRRSVSDCSRRHSVQNASSPACRWRKLASS